MSLQLNIHQINYLNIVLMFLSAVLAYAFPFELFLFAYAFLGPLHYLTEISWLHDRNYYTQGRYDFIFLLAASIGVTFIFLKWIPFAPKGTIECLTFLAFWAAFFFAVLKGAMARYASLVPGLLAAFLFAHAPAYQAVFGIFLPTLIHVFLFTGLFILAGALRGKSASGLFSLLVFIGLALSFVFFHPAHTGYQVSPYVRDSYGYFKDDNTGSSPFVLMNLYIAKVFSLHDFGNPNAGLMDYVKGVNGFLYQNPLALSLMSFIAFAYTYHYFNWFSKTSIIGWHEISRGRAIVLLAVWAVSLGLYAYDYSVGLRWLFFLSFTHVLLEFPLNQLTLIGIGKELLKRISTQPSMVGVKK